MTEYNTPLTPAQQEISELLDMVKDAISDLKDLSGVLKRVGLHAAAEEIQETVSDLDKTYSPVVVRFIRGEI